MKYLFILPALLCIMAASAQDVATKTIRGNTLAIKGKALPWLAIGEGINYTLGIEYGFAKKHAIGVDFVYNDYSVPNEIYDTVTGTYRARPRVYTVSRGIFLNYRYYFKPDSNAVALPLDRLYYKGGVPYLSLFLRYGKLDKHYPDGYATNTISYDEWQYSGGLLFGAIIGIVDINTGPFYKQKYFHEVQQGLPWGTSDVRSTAQKFGWRLGVNLFIVTKRNSTHYLATYDRSISK